MFSEIFRFLVTPIGWIFIILAFNLAILGKLLKQRGYRVCWYCLLTGTFILYLLSTVPIANTLVYSLESKYQSPSKEDISALEIVVILGGGIYPSNELKTIPEASGATYSRVFNGVMFFKQSNAKILVLSGAGKGGNESEAEVMRDLAVILGVPKNKIVTETKSQNTMEHAIELAKLFPPAENRKIGVVTSALHMPRAVQSFKEKFPEENIVPIPVGYIFFPKDYGLGSFFPAVDALDTSSAVVHEEIGMIWYRFLAWKQ